MASLGTGERAPSSIVGTRTVPPHYTCQRTPELRGVSYYLLEIYLQHLETEQVYPLPSSLSNVQSVSPGRTQSDQSCQESVHPGGCGAQNGQVADSASSSMWLFWASQVESTLLLPVKTSTATGAGALERGAKFCSWVLHLLLSSLAMLWGGKMA